MAGWGAWIVRGLVAAGLVAVACVSAGAAEVQFTLGVHELEGEFEGTNELKLTHIPLDLTFGGLSSNLTIRLPYLRIDRSGNVVMTADGPVILGVGGPGRASFQSSEAGRSESGFGDIVIRDETFFLRIGQKN